MNPDEIQIADGILVRRMGTIERGKHRRRHVDGWAVIVDGREHQPWMIKRTAVRMARNFARDRKSQP